MSFLLPSWPAMPVLRIGFSHPVCGETNCIMTMFSRPDFDSQVFPPSSVIANSP